MRNEYLDVEWCNASLFRIEPGDYICVEVQDSGIGIPEELQQKIFEPFFTSKPEGKGTGLGLAAVYGTVRSHKGTLGLKSLPGIGSTFSVCLPAIMAEVESPGRQSRHRQERGEGKVLVIEDEAAVRGTAQMILELCGYATLAAPSGAEGLELYRQHAKEIVAVLLDVVLPDMDGYDVLSQLQKIDPEVKVVLTSGFTQYDYLLNGIRAFLKKPCRKDELIEAIRQVNPG